MNDTKRGEKKLRFWQVAALSFFLGLLLATTFAPLHLVFLLPICFSGLLILLNRAETKVQAFFVGWWFGWGQFVAGLYWIGVAFTIDAEAHAALIPLPTLGLPAFLALFTGLATLLTFKSTAPGLWRVLAFAGFWTLTEYVRGLIFTGFPWNLAGYSWGNVLPMIQWASFIGIYGLTLLTVLVSSIPSVLTNQTLTVRQKNAAILIDCVMIALMVFIGYMRIPNEALAEKPDSLIRIVQPNIPQKDKWKAEKKFHHVRKLVDLSKQQAEVTPQHLIWPETAIPFFLTTDENLKFYLQKIIPKDGFLITGAPRKSTEVRQYWNSVQILDSQGQISGVYDKKHLVPYGEYMPMRQFMVSTGLTTLIPALDQMSDFSIPNEQSSKTLTVPGIGSARVLICYEVAFPWEVQSEQDFDWILNATNDAWFGDTTGPYQHFLITRVRAIEQGMSVVRAANTGMSAIIDGYGRVLKKLPLNETGIIDASIPVAIDGETFYQNTGEILPLLLILLCIVPGLMWGRSSDK